MKSLSVSRSQLLSITASAGYTYSVEAFSGLVEDCLGPPIGHNHYGPVSRLHGTRGAAEGHVRIGTFSGNVSLCDH